MSSSIGVLLDPLALTIADEFVEGEQGGSPSAQTEVRKIAREEARQLHLLVTRAQQGSVQGGGHAVQQGVLLLRQERAHFNQTMTPR